MTTWAPTFSPRFKGHYRAAGVAHTITVRGARGDTFSVVEGLRIYVGQVFDYFATAMADDLEWTSAEVALTDSDVFAPCDPPDITEEPVVDAATYSVKMKTSGLTFSAKSATARTRLTIYGLYLPSDAVGSIGTDGLVTIDEMGEIAGAATLMSAHFKGADGEPVTFYLQGTYKQNDRLVKLARRGLIA